jgi:alpha-tubulin suppressor-like RCC1 family protein
MRAPLTGATEVACGSSGFCIALSRLGTVFGWGSNAFSQLGLPAGGALSIATPIVVNPGYSIEEIAAGSAHCIAHSLDGNIYGWGYNGRGQLGTGSTSVAQATPVVMNAGPDGMDGIVDLAAGTNFSVMVRHSDRAVFVTGDNQSGQLGIPGNKSSQKVPVRSGF